MMKKIVSLLLIAVMIMSLASFASSADVISTTYYHDDITTGECSEHASWTTQSDFWRLDADGKAAAEAGYPLDALYGTVSITVEEAGEYSLSVNLRSHESTGNYRLYVNGSEEPLSVYLDGRCELNGVSPNTFFDVDCGKVNLVSGVNTLKFVCTGEGGENADESNRYKINLRSITISAEKSYSMFSDGRINAEQTATIKQETETGYVFTDENGIVTEKESYTASASGYGGTFNIFETCMKGSYFSYTVSVPNDGLYSCSIMSRLHDKGFGEFMMSIDSVEVGSYENKWTSGSYYNEYALGSIELTAGEHVVTFTAIGSGARDVVDSNCWGPDYFTISQVSTNFTIESDDFSAFISSRDAGAAEHDLRFIIAASLEKLESYDELYVTLIFKDSNKETVKSITKNAAEELEFYASATAAGNRYTAGNNCALFGMVITDVPDAEWATAELLLSTSESVADTVVKGSISASAALS